MISTSRHQTSDLPAERRQVTVLFCDLVESTAFGAGRDEEDVLEVFAGYQRGVAEIVARFGGYVAKYMGDGVLAYFGYPEAHEDDAERAVRAGLALVSAVERITTPAQGLQLRVGIATGLVVVGSLIGSGPAQERTVVGEAPSLAARLQALASPDTVMIGDRTHRLIGDLFACRPIGPVSLKGFAEPQLAWKVTGASAATSRFEALRAARLTPMVGRLDEIAALQRRWEQVKDGHGQVVLLSGEPGIGKSRLVATLCEQDWMRSTPHTELRLDSLPHHTASVLHPFIAQLEHAAGLHGVAGPGERLSKLEAALAPASLPGEDVSLLADLLSIPTGGCYPALDLAPQRRRERTAEAILGLVRGLARRQPVLLVFEDAHWSDEASLEVLSLVVDHAPAYRVLVVVTSRPEFDAPWAGRPHVTLLTLERLEPLEAAAIARWIVGADAPAREIVGDVVERADGVPLFIEELTKALLETQAAPGTAAAIPFTLHGSLTARLDHLGLAAREVVQVAAVIGRDVSAALLAMSVATLDTPSLEAAVQELTCSGLMLRREGAPETRYSFKHALVQNAAYGALLRRRRRELHARVVGAIEAVEPATLEREPQALARHCTEGELFEKAVAYRLKAGVLAFKRSALAESVEQLEAGLGLLDRVDDDGVRSAHALALQASLARVLAVARGYGDPSVGEAYARARELCQGIAEPRRIAEVSFGEFGFHLIRGHLRSALTIAEEMPERAARSCDEAITFCAHACRGMALAHMGKLAASSESLQAAVAMQERVDPIALSSSFGELQVLVHGYLAWVLVARGCLDQARKQEAELLGMAPLASRTLGAACASCFSAWSSQLRRDADAVRPWIDPLVRLCDEHGFAFWQAASLAAKGWLVADAGKLANGIALLEKGLAAYRAIGSETLRSIAANALAEALTQAGRSGRAIAVLDEALTVTAENGDRLLEAEMLRLKGEALVSSGCDDAGEECFAAAIRVAREQGALLWELRASVRLAGLWLGRSRVDDARDLLRPVHDRFREGLHSRDLRAARAVLEAVTL